MKIGVFTLLILSQFYTFDYDFFFYSKSWVHKDLKKITEITGKKKDGKIISSFNNEGYLLQEVYFVEDEIRADYKSNYIVTDTLLEIETISNDKVTTRQYYYTSSGQCYKYRAHSLGSEKPVYTADSFTYKNGVLVGYIKGYTNSYIKSILETKVICKYNDKKQKIHEISIFRNDADTTFYTYAYNRFGQLTDYIQESKREDVAYSGTVVWSKRRKNKIHIRFSNFDECGNWTKSYYMTSRGKVFRSERMIEYWGNG